MRVFAYIARRYNSAAESTSLLSSVASLAIKIKAKLKIQSYHRKSELNPQATNSDEKEILKNFCPTKRDNCN